MQNFSIYTHKSNDPYKQFMWLEDDNGYEKYGFLYSLSVSGCLHQILEYLEDEFVIDIQVGDNHGGPCTITNREELSVAIMHYSSFIPS